MKTVAWDETYVEKLINLWNRELGLAFPMRDSLFKQNSVQDKNVCRDSSWIVLNNDNDVIGFIIVKVWQEKIQVQMSKTTGWIQVLLVDHRYRNKGIGTKLLEHAEEVLHKQGIQQILLGRDPWHYFPGIPIHNEQTKQWFFARGYKAYGTEHDLLKTYNKTTTVTKPDFPEIDFSVLHTREKKNFLAFLHRCFPGRWEYEAIKYFEFGGTGREFVVMRKRGRLIGFCRINDPNSPIIAQNVYWAPLFETALGGVGPLGIDALERGQGYGLAVVEAGIAELRNRGIQKIVIDWTGLVDFYKKLGYEVWKSYTSFKKLLESGGDS
ncbi:GNAT family N-acetyltransferase [Virgibacillus sp.]|uniref:GNAT family N-acetyltransferase n=1 Tax=Virgibacillus sp. TaxID=1872700 RepID=UPI0017EA82CF|nr:GNAT family N-acetyltransferase [Virgibacillus sp.]NWO14538.1 GNAT family N-acetyltransferase [Virgibacillus sp.]